MDIFAGDHALTLLRKIAETTSQISVDDVAGDACLLRLMIADGAVVNDDMFVRACLSGHTEIVRLLLDHGSRLSAAVQYVQFNFSAGRLMRRLTSGNNAP